MNMSAIELNATVGIITPIVTTRSSPEAFVKASQFAAVNILP
jgi:hypothetical protein